MDKWKRRVFEPKVDLNKEQSARPENPIHHSEAWEPVPCPRLLWSLPGIRPAVPALRSSPIREMRRLRGRSGQETICGLVTSQVFSCQPLRPTMDEVCLSTILELLP